MPYATNEKFEKLIKQGFQDEEIKKGIEEANIPESILTQIAFNKETMWGIATEEIKKYDSIENQIKENKTAIIKELGYRPLPLRSYDHGLPKWVLWVTLFLAPLILIVTGYAIYHFGWESLLQFYLPNWWLKIIAASIILLSLLFVGILHIQPYQQIIKWFRDRKIAQWESRAEEIRTRTGEKDLQPELTTLEESINKTILQSYVKDQIRLEINRYLVDSYEEELQITEAPGLAEIIDPSRTVDTKAKKSLQFLLENMPGGSIGIAGLRGAGKSTLIHAYCGPNRSIDKIKNLEILPVFTSAPVHYDGRDFILHLFSSLCRSILNMTGQPDDPGNRDPDEQEDENRFPFSLAFLAPVRMFILFTGLFLMLLAVTLGLLLANSPAKEASDKTVKAIAAIKQPLFIRLLTTMEIKPGSLFIGGLTFVLIYLAIYFLLRHYRKTRELRKRSEILKRLDYKRRLAGIPDNEKINFNIADINLTLDKPIVTLSALVPDARNWLRQIKFQQSFTSGWSGGLKLPVGLEGSINKAVTLAEKQMTNPEIASAFLQLVSSVPAQYQIVIGIDELDKLESEEVAQQFINEIKSIFGYPRCFFLISLSENAMSNFERRGLPLRDVFDSSFDSIVYVDYLNFDAAKLVLSRRIIGKPILFISFSYCLSGGLARDLIRAFRSILELRQSNPQKNDISFISSTIIFTEIRNKVRAMMITTKKMDPSQELISLHKIHHDLLQETLNEPTLTASLDLLGKLKDTCKNNEKDSSPEKISYYHLLQSFIMQSAVFIYYMKTLLDVFTHTDVKQKIKTMIQNGGLDKLAAARQAIAVEQSIGKRLIDGFRQGEGLMVADFE